MTMIPRADSVRAFLLFGALLGFATPSEAQWRCASEQKVQPADLAAGDIYAAAVAVEGDVAVVASEWDDDNGVDSGAVYVYRLRGNRWMEEQKLTPADGSAGDNFGRSVDIHGNFLVVGAHWDDDRGVNAGAAYVFVHDGSQWHESQKLVASDGRSDDRFGISVAIDGDGLAVGAWRADPGAVDAGATYVYRQVAGLFVDEQKLLASDGQAGDNFGRYVALSADALVVGAYRDDDNGANSGSAYVFRRGASLWTQEQKLTAPDGLAGDEFGWATFVLGDEVVVGAPRHDAAGNDAGAVYVYRFNGNSWIGTAKLTAPDAHPNNIFGFSVALDGGWLMATSPVSLDMTQGPGSAYVFRGGGAQWTFEQKTEPSDGAPQDAFGFHASMSGRTLLVGAWRDDDAGPDSGSAYFYTCLGKRTSLGRPLRGTVTIASGGAAVGQGLESAGPPVCGEDWILLLASSELEPLGLWISVQPLDPFRALPAGFENQRGVWVPPAGRAADGATRYVLPVPSAPELVGARLRVTARVMHASGVGTPSKLDVILPR